VDSSEVVSTLRQIKDILSISGWLDFQTALSIALIMFPIEPLRVGLDALNFTNDSLSIWSGFVFFFPYVHSFFFHYVIIVEFSLAFSEHQHLLSPVMDAEGILLLIVKVHSLVLHQAEGWQYPWEA
jgi:hypothetical protein